MQTSGKDNKKYDVNPVAPQLEEGQSVSTLTAVRRAYAVRIDIISRRSVMDGNLVLLLRQIKSTTERILTFIRKYSLVRLFTIITYLQISVSRT